MKIRTGFVSNSSSSSFCIIGKYLSEEDIKEIEDRTGEDFWDLLTEKNTKVNGRSLVDYGCDDVYIGLDVTDLKDSDCIGDVKKAIAKKLTEIFENECKPEEIEIICETTYS